VATHRLEAVTACRCRIVRARTAETVDAGSAGNRAPVIA
jgi:hypothetical protein